MANGTVAFNKLRFHRCQFCGRLQDNPNFWRKVKKLPGKGCWEWTGQRNPNGYGVFSVPPEGASRHRKRYVCSRYALECALGRPLKPGHWALHECDNPACVRVGPGHLYEGTAAQNSRDMVERGRMTIGDRKGEANGRHKLTAVQVAEIRVLYSPKSLTANQYTIAKQYGVSRSTIRALLSGPNWKGAACPA